MQFTQGSETVGFNHNGDYSGEIWIHVGAAGQEILVKSSFADLAQGLLQSDSEIVSVAVWPDGSEWRYDEVRRYKAVALADPSVVFTIELPREAVVTLIGERYRDEEISRLEIEESERLVADALGVGLIAKWASKQGH